MKTSTAGRKLIEKYEGLILQAYDDKNDKIVQPGQTAQGTLTIGYGHTNAAGPPKVTPGMKITRDQADQILSADLASVEAEVSHLVKVPLNQNQFDALVSFQFNTGWLARKNCSLTNHLNQGLYDQAAKDFLMYNRAQGKVLEGLAKRRAEESKMFQSKDTHVDDTTKTSSSTGAVVVAAGAGVAAHAYLGSWLVTLGVVGGIILAAAVIIHFINKAKK